MGGVSKGSAGIRSPDGPSPGAPPWLPWLPWLRAGEAGSPPAAKGGPPAHRHIYLAGGLGNRGGEGQRGMERRPTPPVLPHAARPARPACQPSEHPRSREAYVARVTSQGPSERWDK